MTETDSQPIAENEQVKELLALLKDNNTPGYEEFAKLIEHVTGMEQRLSEATKELKAVRQEMQGLQNHSLKDALQKSCKAMETNISVMRHRLSKLKGPVSYTHLCGTYRFNQPSLAIKASPPYTYSSYKNFRAYK